jgi:hypothetical protein
METDVDTDDDDSDDNDSVVAGVLVVVIGSAAKVGSKKEELLHAKKICKVRSTVVHAGAIFIPDQKGAVWTCEELSLSLWNGIFASSLVDDGVER